MQQGYFAAAFIISYLILGVLGFLLALFVFFNRPRSSIKSAFARYLFIVSWWGLFSVPMLLAQNEYWGTFWDRVCLLGLILTPVSFIHFNFVFLDKEKKYRNFIILNYLISVFFLLVSFTPMFVAGTSPRFGLNYFTDPGLLYHLFFIYFFLTSFLGIATFFSGYIKAKGLRRRQLFNIFWSSILGYSLGGLTYFTVLKMPPAFLGIIANAGIIFHMIVYAYTITKQRLLDISVVISRIVAWILTIIFLIAIYLLLTWVCYEYVSSRINFLFMAITIVYGIIVGETFQRLRLLIQTTSDKLFLHGKYDYYQALETAGAEITKTLSMENILNTLSRIFTDVVEVSNPRVYLPADFTRAEVKGLIQTKEIISKGGDLIIPCILEERLIALIVLGRKLSEDDYTDEDLKLLKALASQIAVAIDHTSTYEEIKEQFDLSQRKLYDTEKLLARSEKIASMTSLIQGYNHEIRTPLNVMSTYLDSLSDDAKISEVRGQLMAQIKRAADIVDSTLRLSMPKERKELPLNLNDIINDALKIYQPLGVNLTKELSPLPTLLGDYEDLKLMFVNLLKNAGEAIRDRGEIKITTYSIKENGAAYVRADIADNGEGIPKENLERIFEPFFSTHVTRGRGLGLSIVFRIVREHLGNITVKSEVGKGTVFTLTLPAKE